MFPSDTVRTSVQKVCISCVVWNFTGQNRLLGEICMDSVCLNKLRLYSAVAMSFRSMGTE